MLHAQGCADIVAINYLRNSAITFCNATQVITEELDAETIDSGTPEVELSPSGRSEVVSIISAYRDGYPLDPISDQELRIKYGNWKNMTGTVSHYTSKNNIIRLFKIPDSSIELVVTVAIRPTLTATTVDDALMNEWKSAIVSGALAEILMLPGMPFTQPQLADVHRSRFKDWIVSAQGKAVKQTHYAPLRTRSW